MAGLGVTTCFAVALLCAIRFTDLREQGRPILAWAIGLAGVLATTAASGAIVFGLIVVA